MQNPIIKALVSTTIKQFTVNSSQLPSSQKHSLQVGTELEVSSYKASASVDHWEVTLKSPIGNIVKWFAYKPHVVILDTPDSALDRIKNLHQVGGFKVIPPIYQRATDQDRASASGKGIFPCDGKFPCGQVDQRSERIYLPFVMATRRQTDSMVRQAYLLLSEDIRRDTAFLIADRLCQNPKAYIKYIEDKKNIVLIGSFIGIDNYESFATFPDWLKELHSLELLQLECSIALIQSYGKSIVDIVYSMGDSPSNYARAFRVEMEKKYHNILESHGLGTSQFLRRLPWGADETTLVSFARQIPDKLKLKVVMSNPKFLHHYDGGATTEELVTSTLEELKIDRVYDNNFDVQVFIFDWKPETNVSNYKFKTYAPNTQQSNFDQAFVDNNIKSLSPNLHSKAIIVDGRNPNGAWDELSIPPSDQFLAFGSWGTLANSLGQTLAFAKLLHFYKGQNKPSIQRQLLLEAIAHDVFIIGHAQVQHDRSPLQNLLKKQPPQNRTQYHRGTYDDVLDVEKLFQAINQFVNSRMSMMMPGVASTKFTVVPQLWRVFESQVFTSDGELSVAGVFRKDLNPTTFDPFIAAKKVQKFGLDELV
ncbi:hypothetical protein [Nostoc sp.]|uniref:hypothetical protein n=1 Tax=Nostoc sp. TaxID=1180 RepID=UPI0035948801